MRNVQAVRIARGLSRGVLMLGLVVGITACGSGANSSDETAGSSVAGSLVPVSPSTSSTSMSTDATVQATTSVPGRDGTTIPNLAKAGFLQRGNQICAEMNSKSAALTASYGPGGPKTPSDTKDMLVKNAELFEGVIDQLKALDQPPGDEALLQSMYSEVIQMASLVRRIADAAGRGDKQMANDLLSQGDAINAKANRDYTDYGLTECGKGS